MAPCLKYGGILDGRHKSSEMSGMLWDIPLIIGAVG